jgi:5-methylcytosine-specific restriction protein B
MNLFFGKFGPKYPDQIEKFYYAGGKEGSTWYGDLELGDYVFPIHNRMVSQLWKAEKYDDNFQNKARKKDVLRFSLVDKFEPVPVSSVFLRYKFFKLDLNMLNKSVKSTKCGFFQIDTEVPFNETYKFNFNQIRKIYIVDKDKKESINYSERDILVVIDTNDDYKILTIEEYISNKFEEYQPLLSLYKEKNKVNQRYSLKQLLNYAQLDKATKKFSYLDALITELEEKQYYVETNPVRLYDNVIVGRKKTKVKNLSQTNLIEIDQDIESSDAEETISNLIANYEVYTKLITENPNLIFYGPPGTGKTYSAQRLVELLEYKATNQFKSYENLLKEERVEFITFHQSYSYEEFVEGIKPVFNSEEDETHSLKYQIQDGLIKNLVNIANLSFINENIDDGNKVGIHKNNKVFKISLGSRYKDQNIYDNCKTNNCIAIGWLGDVDLTNLDKDEISRNLKDENDKATHTISSINLFVNELNIGDIVFVYDGPYTVRDIGIVTSDYYFDSNYKNNYPHRRSVKWVKEFTEPFDISNLNGNVQLTLKTLYPLKRIQFSDIKEILFNDIEETTNDEKSLKPCYLIIDEINRGNISKIFGELITLIEKDKRDTLTITLPYSQKPFKVPSNLYIIGTMNTADRSIAILDTALRRRFTFVEIEPNPEVITDIGEDLVEDVVDLRKLLYSLNRKIIKYYDRDHRIGHSYFLDISSLAQFRLIWSYKIIPLLMDYFYNDFVSISKIIGKDFFDNDLITFKSLSDEKFFEAVQKIYEEE